MYKKPYEPYIRITLKELISAIMVGEERTSIRTGEVYDRYLELSYEMKQKGIYGEVLYSRNHLNEFKYENGGEFEVGIGYIALRDGYNLDWLQENVVSHIPTQKLQILGLLAQEDIKTF